MRHTPLTDTSILTIEIILHFLQTIDDELVFYPEGAKSIIELLDHHIASLNRVNIDEIKEEFWDLSNEFQDPIRLKNIYKVKFKNLLNWIGIQKFDSKHIINQAENIIVPFINRHTVKNIPISFDEALNINILFLLITTNIDSIRTDIESLLEQCDAFAGTTNGSPMQNEKVLSNPQYSIAPKRKTDFIKLVSSMYDARMFVGADGSPATNKQKLMDAFGEFLNDDFSTYSSSLSQAKTRDEKVFLKPFKEIEKAALEYYNRVEE